MQKEANSVSFANVRIDPVNKVAFQVSCPWTRTDTLEKTSQRGMKRSQSPWTPRKRRDAKKNTGGSWRPSANGRRLKPRRGDAWKSRGYRPWRGGFGKRTEGRSSWRRGRKASQGWRQEGGSSPRKGGGWKSRVATARSGGGGRKAGTLSRRLSGQKSGRRGAGRRPRHSGRKERKGG